ncbi:MAG: hypothetical protein QG568_684 [Patescibacteria group bacterium]|nr:hypothetical protein [Patescibacteria group bacterium]
MTDQVSFENNNEVKGYSRYTTDAKMPYLTRLVIRIGLAKDENKANKILIITAGVLLLLAIVLFVISMQPTEVKVLKIQARPAPLQTQ